MKNVSVDVLNIFPLCFYALDIYKRVRGKQREAQGQETLNYERLAGETPIQNEQRPCIECRLRALLYKCCSTSEITPRKSSHAAGGIIVILLCEAADARVAPGRLHPILKLNHVQTK